MGALKNKRKEKACQVLVTKGLKQCDAYREAYPGHCHWKATTINQHASRLFAEPEVKARIGELQMRMAEIAQEEFDVDAKYVLKRLVDIDRMDVADIIDDHHNLKPISDWPPIWRQFVHGIDLTELHEGRGDERQLIGILKKIKWPDKLKNLEMLGKHVEVRAFRDQVGVSDPEGNALPMGPQLVVNTGKRAAEADGGD